MFDDEGFSLTDINETLVGEEVIQQQDDVYFLDSDDDIPDRKSKPEVGGDDRVGLSLEEDVDLQRARVSMMCYMVKRHCTVNLEIVVKFYFRSRWQVCTLNLHVQCLCDEFVAVEYTCKCSFKWKHTAIQTALHGNKTLVSLSLSLLQQMILLRQEATNGRSRQHDFLQGITMKIRFMKRLTVEDLDK